MNTALKLDQLIKLLEQESEIHRSMLDVVDREKEAVVRSDLAALQETAIKKKKLISEMAQTGALRQQAVLDLAAALGIPDQDLNLTRISHEVDEPIAGRFMRVQAEFSAVLHRLRTANERNRQIVLHSLALVRESFNLLNDVLAPGKVYFRDGNIQSPKPNGKCVSSVL
jgi:flagellar biosynthesis/type III secretory pathway chaperone